MILKRLSSFGRAPRAAGLSGSFIPILLATLAILWLPLAQVVHGYTHAHQQQGHAHVQTKAPFDDPSPKSPADPCKLCTELFLAKSIGGLGSVPLQVDLNLAQAPAAVSGDEHPPAGLFRLPGAARGPPHRAA